MVKREDMDKCFDVIMALKGADEFKETVKRLHICLKNRKANLPSNVKLPNYLLTVKRGGGVTTLVNAFAEYLYAANAIEFRGIVKAFEFRLDYIVPETFFSELTRFHNTISDFAGHNRFYKGVVCVNIDEWLEATGEDHFTKFLNYIASYKDKLFVIFCLHSVFKKNIISVVESALASHIRVESLTLRFPGANELVEFVESRYMRPEGLSLKECAKRLLGETITVIAAGKRFNGFKTVEQLADDILYNVHITDLGRNKRISAEMLSGFSKESEYVKRAIRLNSVKKVGFSTERIV